MTDPNNEFAALLPCPFCGSDAQKPYRTTVAPKRPEYKIGCVNYCVSMRRSTIKAVVRAWNTRHAAPAPRQEERAKALADIVELSNTRGDKAWDELLATKFLSSHYETIRAALSQPASAAPKPEGGDGWRTIDSAPMDGTYILCYLPYSGGFITQTFWHIDEKEGVWFDESGEMCPTHWQPLPQPPSKDESHE